MRTAIVQTAYQAYLADPGMRERIDREVRHLRAEAVRRFIATPIARCIARIATTGRRAAPATTNP